MLPPSRRVRPARRLSLLLPLLLAGGLGCAVSSPTVSLYPGPPAPAEAAKTGVFAFADERPAVQQEGKKPRLVPLVLFNWRRGEYVTGDRHFEQPPATALAEGVTDVLGQGRFGPAALLPGEPSGGRGLALERCQGARLDYAAVGTLTEMYGSVDQNAYLFVFPVPFLWLFGYRNDKSDPLGVIDLRLDVFECRTGELAYRRRLQRRQRFPKRTPSEAVRLAMADLLEQLANETRSAWGSPRPGD